jgi:hypothetical protein
MPTKKAATPAQIRAAFLLLAAVAPFSEGDTVKVLRTCSDNELGSEVYDCDSSNEVGKEFKVTSLSGPGEYEIDNGYYYPFFCLQLIRKSDSIELNSEYTAVISDDGKSVEVGCQDIPAAKVLELAERIKVVQAKQPVKKAVAKKKNITCRRF